MIQSWWVSSFSRVQGLSWQAKCFQARLLGVGPEDSLWAGVREPHSGPAGVTGDMPFCSTSAAGWWHQASVWLSHRYIFPSSEYVAHSTLQGGLSEASAQPTHFPEEACRGQGNPDGEPWTPNHWLQCVPSPPLPLTRRPSLSPEAETNC